MALDKRYLERHGNQWRVQVKVPEKVRHIVGKAKLVQSLHTESLAAANKMRWPVIAALKKIITDAEAHLGRKGSIAADPLVSEAMFIRDEYAKAQDDPLYAAQRDEHGELMTDGAQFIKDTIADRAQEIFYREGEPRADLFYGIATGEETPIMLLLDQWLDERQIKPRQKQDYKRAVVKLDAYLRANRKRTSIQPVSRRIAGAYVQSLVSNGTHAKTINKDISALSSYWKWLVKRGHVDQNVWQGQSVEKPKIKKDQAKRPFSDDEVGRLLHAEAPSYLRDAMWIAAFSGLRVEEIAKLRAIDTTGDMFSIHEAKTKAGERVVPIHSYLRSLVAERSNGKNPEDFLFHELPTPKLGSPVERSQKISKRFTALRRAQGIDEQVAGQRQSRIDFHSFRRWFITKAETAGVPPHIISAVVGHTRQGMTLGVYSGGPSVEQLRTCVEAVRLEFGDDNQSLDHTNRK